MSRHVYLEPSDLDKPVRGRASTFLLVWIAVLAGFVTVWHVTDNEPIAIALFVIGCGATILIAVIVRTRSAHALADVLKAIELARLRERADETITRARALLRTKVTAFTRAQVLLSLGTCAESEGDFAEAADIFVRAEGALRAAPMAGMVRNQFLAVIAARRAFAHAACGDLARARATLASAHVPDGLPAAVALARRAELVIVLREGVPGELEALLAKSETLLRNALTWRDRALVHVMRRMARTQAGARHLELEPDPSSLVGARGSRTERRVVRRRCRVSDATNLERAFRDATATPQAGGIVIHRFNPTLALFVLTIGATTITALAVALMASAGRVAFAGFALLAWAIVHLLYIWIVSARQRRGVRLNNNAVAMLGAGDDLHAVASLRSAIGDFYPRDIVAMSLYNLGIVATRERDVPSATKLFRASVAASTGPRISRADLYAGLSRAQLAFTLAITGELDEAESIASDPGASALAVAFGARARAAIALKRGRFEEVVTILDGERALLRNALSLQDAILAEAMRAYALSRLGSSYRGVAHASAPIYADDLARAYVRSMLPETEPMLVSS